MQQVKTFLERIELEKQADTLLKSSYNTNEAGLSHLLNNKGQRHASGKLEEYKRLLNTCKFKLVVYFSNDKFGRPYTIEEKIQAKHRRFIPSVDRVRDTINEELGLNTLIDYCLQNQSVIEAGQIILIDRLNNEELTIFKFNSKIISASQYCQMKFKTNEFGNTYFEKMLETPLRIDTIKNFKK